MTLIGGVVADPAKLLENYPEVLTTNEVAELWRVTAPTVRRLLEEGRLEGFRLTADKRSAPRIYKASVIAFMAANADFTVTDS